MFLSAYFNVASKFTSDVHIFFTIHAIMCIPIYIHINLKFNFTNGFLHTAMYVRMYYCPIFTIKLMRSRKELYENLSQELAREIFSQTGNYVMSFQKVCRFR